MYYQGVDPHVEIVCNVIRRTVDNRDQRFLYAVLDKYPKQIACSREYCGILSSNRTCLYRELQKRYGVTPSLNLLQSTLEYSTVASVKFILDEFQGTLSVIDNKGYLCAQFVIEIRRKFSY